MKFTTRFVFKTQQRWKSSSNHTHTVTIKESHRDTTTCTLRYYSIVFTYLITQHSQKNKNFFYKLEKGLFTLLFLSLQCRSSENGKVSSEQRRIHRSWPPPLRQKCHRRRPLPRAPPLDLRRRQLRRHLSLPVSPARWRCQRRRWLQLSGVPHREGGEVGEAIGSSERRGE